MTTRYCSRCFLELFIDNDKECKGCEREPFEKRESCPYHYYTIKRVGKLNAGKVKISFNPLVQPVDFSIHWCIKKIHMDGPAFQWEYYVYSFERWLELKESWPIEGCQIICVNEFSFTYLRLTAIQASSSFSGDNLFIFKNTNLWFRISYPVTADGLGGTNNYFGLWWGSIIEGNRLTFFTNYPGSRYDIYRSKIINAGLLSAGESGYINLVGVPEFVAFQLYNPVFAFEADNISIGYNPSPVPEPASIWLFYYGFDQSC